MLCPRESTTPFMTLTTRKLMLYFFVYPNKTVSRERKCQMLFAVVTSHVRNHTRRPPYLIRGPARLGPRSFRYLNYFKDTNIHYINQYGTFIRFMYLSNNNNNNNNNKYII